MNILFNSCQVLGINIHLIWLQTLFDTVSFASIHNIFQVFLIVKSSHIARIQNWVKILNHLFINYLSISKQETRLFIIQSCLHQYLFNVLSPRFHAVIFYKLNETEHMSRNKYSHFCQRLSSTSSNSQK